MRKAGWDRGTKEIQVSGTFLDYWKSKNENLWLHHRSSSKESLKLEESIPQSSRKKNSLQISDQRSSCVHYVVPENSMKHL